MSYFDISFQKDLFRELLVGFDSLDDLYLASPQQLWHLSGPHGRLLQDGQFYGDKIKERSTKYEVMYGVDKLPKIPDEIYLNDKLQKYKYKYKYKYEDEKELMALWEQSRYWSLDNRLIFASVMGSLALLKYSVEKGADMRSPSKNDKALYEAARSGHFPRAELLTTFVT